MSNEETLYNMGFFQPHQTSDQLITDTDINICMFVCKFFSHVIKSLVLIKNV
jgi:hypothetical protein